jgi:hypothetical protein
MKKCFIFNIFIFISTLSIAQNDNINWSSFQLQKQLSEKLTLNIKPIFRFNQDISNFQNMSIEVFAGYKFAKGWTAQLTSRTWFIPDQKPRQFIWPEVSYGISTGDLKIDSRLRYHLALDINNREDPDFVRWRIRFMHNKGKVKPFIAVEPWLRLNGIDQLQRVRYIAGLNWKLDDTYSLSFVYWKQESINRFPMISDNLWLINLLIKLK